VSTPLAAADVHVLDGNVIAVPILRAGLGLLTAVTGLLPDVQVGYIGLERDEETLQPVSYYLKVPPLDERPVLLLDPMLATGGSASFAAGLVASDSAPAKPAAPAAADEAPPSEEAKPALDLSLPNPTTSECVARLVPRALDGLESGEAMMVGQLCGGSDWWVEHWLAGKRNASFEKLPEVLNAGRAAIAMTVAGEAYVAALGTDLLMQRRGDQWRKILGPTKGELAFIGAAPGGRLWVVQGGKVFSRLAQDRWRQLVLPGDESATALMVSDSEQTFVVAGRKLFGPPDAAPREVVEIGPGATSLCQEPYVIVRRDIKRTERYPDEVAKVQKAGVSGAELVFGHRGMFGEDAIQAKLSNMTSARKLSKALGGADIVCGEPRNVLEVP
jgi:hypothetical protein